MVDTEILKAFLARSQENKDKQMRTHMQRSIQEYDKSGQYGNKYIWGNSLALKEAAYKATKNYHHIEAKPSNIRNLGENRIATDLAVAGKLTDKSEPYHITSRNVNRFLGLKPYQEMTMKQGSHWSAWRERGKEWDDADTYTRDPAELDRMEAFRYAREKGLIQLTELGQKEFENIKEYYTKTPSNYDWMRGYFPHLKDTTVEEYINDPTLSVRDTYGIWDRDSRKMLEGDISFWELTDKAKESGAKTSVEYFKNLEKEQYEQLQEEKQKNVGTFENFLEQYKDKDASNIEVATSDLGIMPTQREYNFSEDSFNKYLKSKQSGKSTSKENE